MQLVKFPCPHCRAVMAVGAELLGRKVRCPHCQSVVVAPAAEPADANSDSGSVDYSQPERQDFDSIFGEPADEDILGLGPPAEPMNFTDEASDEPDFAPPEPAAPPMPFAESSPPNPPASPDKANALQSLVLALLVPYSILMTIVAAWAYYKYQSAPHPLELIQDMGDFQKTTKRVSAQVLKLPSATLPLPSRLVTTLNQPITVGDLRVTPLKVEKKPVTAFSQRQGGGEPERITLRRDSLVLHLKLKNVSDGVEFIPTDPYFDRRPRDSADKPFTALEIGGKFHHGGLIKYSAETGRVRREWVEGQELDDQQLPPGKERATVVCTYPQDAVIEELKKAGRATWRVHVRRGLYPYRGKDVPTTAVVGVAFDARDVVTQP